MDVSSMESHIGNGVPVNCRDWEAAVRMRIYRMGEPYGNYAVVVSDPHGINGTVFGKEPAEPMPRDVMHALGCLDIRVAGKTGRPEKYGLLVNPRGYLTHEIDAEELCTIKLTRGQAEGLCRLTGIPDGARTELSGMDLPFVLSAYARMNNEEFAEEFGINHGGSDGK